MIIHLGELKMEYATWIKDSDNMVLDYLLFATDEGTALEGLAVHLEVYGGQTVLLQYPAEPSIPGPSPGDADREYRRSRRLAKIANPLPTNRRHTSDPPAKSTNHC